MPAIVAQEKLAAGEIIRHNAPRVLEAVTRRDAPEAGRPDEAPGLQRHQAVKNGNIQATWHHFCNSPNQSVAILHNGFVQGRDRACDGATTAVIGPNAAGKSTRFKRIAGLISGPYAVQLSDATRGARAIYYMLQDTGSNAVLTADESLLLAAKQGGSWRVQNEELFEIDANREVPRIENLAFRGMDALSGGQRQLASLGQALVRKQEVLLVDEPDSARPAPPDRRPRVCRGPYRSHIYDRAHRAALSLRY